MAKKKKETELETPCAVDLKAEIKININNQTSCDYSVCAFGTDLINWKNYIGATLEETKKNMWPRIGTVLRDREGLKYRFSDIRLGEVKRNGETIPQYIFDLTYLPGSTTV